MAVQAAAQTEDLSGVGSSLSPRVMVIIDNSRSMEALPTDDYDFSYKDDFLSSAIMTDQGGGNYLCDPANATVQANCRNKFCVGQCVLHNVFDPFDGILEFGFATYFQYYRKVVSQVVAPVSATTTCTYDVLAGAGEDPTAVVGAGLDYNTNRRYLWSKETGLTTAGSCTISNNNTVASRHSLTGPTTAAANGYGTTLRSTNEFGCTPKAAPVTTEPAKTCVALTTTADQVFTSAAYPLYTRTTTNAATRVPALFTHMRYSDIMPSGASIGVPKPYILERCYGTAGQGCTVVAGVPPTTGNLPSTGATSWVIPTALPSYNSTHVVHATNPTVNDGKTWYLYRRTTFPDPLASGYIASDMNYWRTIAPVATNVCPAPGTVDTFTPNPTNAASGTVTTSASSVAVGINTWTQHSQRCTAAQPCKMTLYDSPAPVNNTQVYYKLPGTPPAGGTLVVGSPFASGTVVTTPQTTNPGTCPARTNETALTGCTAGNPCDLLAGTVISATAGSDVTKYTYDQSVNSYTFGGNNYTTTGASSVTTINATTFDSATFPAAGRNGATPAAAGCPASITSTSAAIGCNLAGNHLGSQCTLVLNTAASLATVAGDPPKIKCQYDRTNRALTSSWPQWQCQFNRREWRYTVPGPRYCRWQAVAYEWRVDSRQYRWTSAGGEAVATTTVAAGGAAPGTNYCSPAAYPPLCPNVLDNSLATTPATCKLAGRQCRLRWNATSGVAGTLNVGKGRKVNANVIGSGSNTDMYCRTVDYDLAGAPAVNTNATSFITPAAITNQWCAGANGVTLDTRTDVLTMSDPYSPTLNPANTGVTVGSTYSRGGTIQSVQYSMDGTTWVNGPMSNMLATKNAGWSRLASGTSLMSAANPTIPLFRPFGAGVTVPQLRQSILNLTMASRAVPIYSFPTGIATCKDGIKNNGETDVDCGGGGCAACNTINITGHSTPLFGSLKNAYDYIANEVVDPNAQCRAYAVVLLTDGQENQLATQPQHPGQSGFDDYGTTGSSTQLVSIVDQIKNAQIQTGSGSITPIGGVKTYVVGFGNAAAGGALDAMAVAAGTAIGSPGSAYNAVDPTNLKNTLNVIFNNIAQNRYTRSKPVLTRDGTSRTLYAASFDILGNAREWQGYLDAYDTTTIGPSGTPPKDWQFSQELNNAGAGSRRLFTWLNDDPLRKVSLHSMGSIVGADATQLVNDMTVADKPAADAVVNFVLNPTKNVAFSGTPAANKSSRLSDIYHSAPAVIGPPSADNSWPAETADNAGYALYKAANPNRPARLFVGSNTGMVHAICEKTGANPVDCGSAGTNARGMEVYAFSPPAILPKLKLTPSAHAFSTDGSFGGADLCLAADCTIAANWKTMLLGSLYRGGNSLFAMDVTNPDTVSYMFKLYAPMLGESWSAPVVGRAQIDAATGPLNRWIALSGGGYWAPSGPLPVGNISNSYIAFDMHTGAVGGGVLLDNNSVVADRRAEFRVDFNAPSCDTTAIPDATCLLPRNSVPARVAVVRDGKTATIKSSFFGDTQGRMWVSNMSSPVVKTWQPNVLFDPSLPACANDIYGTPGGAPIYDATDIAPSPTAVATLPFATASTPRPFFQRVSLSVDPEGHVTAYGGTGNVLDPLYTGTNAGDPKQYDYFYAVRYNDGVAGTCYGTASWIRRFRHNEKMLSEASIGGSVVFAATFMPPTGGSICNMRGDGRIYAFYSATGAPAPVFDDPMDPSNPAARSAVLDVPNSGILSDLYFVPDASNRNKGTVGFVDSAGKPAQHGITGIAAGAKVKSFKRVR
jgi:hypothetical protein